MATSNSKRAIRTLVILLVVTIALFGIMAFNKSWTPKLGLDLRGGTTITLTASNISGDGAIDKTSLELARTILQQRVDSIGVGESEVATSGERQIVVTVPNVQKDELVRMVGQTAQLYFRQVYQVTDAQGTPQVTSKEAPQGEATQATPQPKKGPMPNLPTPVPSPRPTKPADPLPSPDQLMEWKPSERDQADFAAYKCGEPFPSVIDQPLIACDQAKMAKYLLGPAIVRGDQLTGANAGIPQNDVNWQVSLSFNKEGAAAFNTWTGKAAAQAPPQNQFAIVLDDKVISAPRVNNAIPGGEAVITGKFTQKEAVELANVLKYGALPLAFDISSVETVSATLGGEQLQAGLIAGAVGLGLVILYSIIYYHGLALVVVASLAIAAAITYAMMVILGQSVGFALNLPGIAGAIVAIGVTADSFVIYFERIRDEAREGRTLRTAIESGWIRSRKTILVADSVSLLSALVLFILAIGAVKGFAFTLGLTTLIDIAIVFWFTKPMMTLLGNTKFFGSGSRFSGFEPDHLGSKGVTKRIVRKEA